MNLTILDVLPYIVTIVTCYITIKICLTRHDMQIKQIEKSLDELTSEVKSNNEVKVRVARLEEQMKIVEMLKEYLKKGE